ncbi:MAG: hypothetical protein B6U88_00375 [Candidatus Aenigmarchaeota archaeon ex4484_56]|nr:MAG: hypothetical protein B6U88_00375 [Candidatus Aenigmarchaeota archaeon ex4484_56]
MTKDIKEIEIFILVTIIYFLGFFILYLSNINLQTIVLLQSKLIEFFVLGTQVMSKSELIVNIFSPIIYSIISFLIFSAGLTLLSVRKIGNIKYLLAIPIFSSGVLFNFSIPFIFFAIGLYIANLYAIPLGETYFLELKKWKKYRVGSNTIGRVFFIIFLITSIGCFISFSINDSYQNLFMNSTIDGIKKVTKAELTNIQMNSDTDMLIDEYMENFRNEYPDLTEEQYAQVKEQIRKNIKNQNSNINITQSIDKIIKNSIMLSSFLSWFPVIMAIVIWLFLEFIRTVIIIPLSGIFSYLWFYGFKNEENKENTDSRNRE